MFLLYQVALTFKAYLFSDGKRLYYAWPTCGITHFNVSAHYNVTCIK